MMTRPIDIKTHLDLLETTLTHLKACREMLDEVGLMRQPALNEWSAVEVLAHLRAAAEVFSHSIFVCLIADQPVLPYIHPNVWWDMQGYSNISFDENWQVFQLNRLHLLRKLRVLTPEQWERSCTIKTQTRTVYGEMRRMALHEKGHYSQIDALY